MCVLICGGRQFSDEGYDPKLADLRYDFDSRTFRDSEGRPLSDRELEARLPRSERSGTPRIGVRTLKRAVLLNSLLRTEGEGRPGVVRCRFLAGVSVWPVGVVSEQRARRQAQDELALAIGDYNELEAKTSTTLYECSRLIAVYVAHGFLSEREVRERFFDAARENGDIEKFGAPWAAITVRKALNDACADPLPPLRPDYCHEVAA